MEMHRFAVPYLCLGALPLLYPAAPPSVFAFGKYTAPAVALVREYVVGFWVVMVWAFDLCLGAPPLLYLRI